MTQPIIPPIEVAPFTQVAVDAAVPPSPAPAEPTPVASTDGAAPPIPVPMPVVADASKASAPNGVSDKLKAAEEAAARIVARRTQQQRAKAEANARARYLASENETLKSRAAAAEAAAKRIEIDPLSVMRERGITDKIVAQAHIDDSTPEGIAARIRQENAELKARLDRFEQQQAASQRETQITQARRRYLEEAQTAKSGDAHTYPYLSAQMKLRPDMVIAEAESIIQEALSKTGRMPSNKDVHEYQEWLYAQGAAEAAKLAGGAQAAPDEETTPAPVQVALKKPAAAGGSRTLASRKAAPATVAKSFAQMTREEQISVMAAQLAAQTPHT